MEKFIKNNIQIWEDQKRKSHINKLLYYHNKNITRVSRKVLRTKPRNFIHPILVKKSYLYRGTPPLIAAKKTKQNASFVVNTNVWLVEYEYQKESLQKEKLVSERNNKFSVRWISFKVPNICEYTLKKKSPNFTL